MSSETDNYNKLASFFSEEYRSLKVYAQSRIDDTVDRDAEDIVQEVAVNIFSRASTTLPIENIAGFVYRSIRNKVVDIMRNKKKVRDHNDPEKLITNLGEHLYEETEQVFSDQMADELKTAIANLKPAYREIIVAIDLEGYTYKEIALETGIPEGTLMSRRHRALSLLFKALEKKKQNIH
ncbi:RNA polymerase sigma factor [Pseudozobellia thermophila]|uniref:RNA polymerase sigma-70 factor, ECF subfamily n=1 Tax=Pseudozobellia thermophila TaxID=192903 RepID=A0A1M6C6N7_9FLAO|nr:RNA polymerase sigma factor [Pseudozobellia thermophila]SHI56649.1 RNA polymerase sigma-70 factor, ECF subfamily [Pseudozobellia thermophila]